MPSCNDCGRFFTTLEALEYHSGWHRTKICPECNQEMPDFSLAGHRELMHQVPIVVVQPTPLPIIEEEDYWLYEDEDSEEQTPTQVGPLFSGELVFNSFTSGMPLQISGGGFLGEITQPITPLFQCAWCESYLPQETMQQHIRDEHLTEILPEPDEAEPLPVHPRPHRVVELAQEPGA